MGKTLAVSPLAPASFPKLPVIEGARFATAQAGVKYKDRDDVMLVSLADGTVMAGAFTRSATRSAAVLDCQEKITLLDSGPAAIIVNSGNANAFTGKNGTESTHAVTSAVAQALEIEENRVFSSSTGVIGEALPHDRITAKLAEMAAALSPAAMEAAAGAIRTTDTFAKGATAEIELDGKTVKIAGIAKGSGMIAPDMATMLVYIFTDAQADQKKLQKLLNKLTDTTFNCITVDSDTSTSDTLLLAATGASGVNVDDNAAFEEALHKVMLDLAHQVVRDGEGATKFVEINVTGAASDADARTHAMAIANSPLVKTAVAGEDPNWGRVVMAIGKSGAAADRDLLSIRFGDILVADNGWVSPQYKEQLGADYMKGQELAINVDLGLGKGKSTAWTCDLTHGYITINADYRS
ncbi:bifunctional glutamate N-acetyltransferase/amino-acid acetyltransferase ArgJ [Thalassobius sp. S69A]|uniref:bifunctional glutamate N-acetyltransferase/amino-acid acetyltransferase ArgJ n=1 Tax=unclassified Thalassovita TaxID=2619711 RepID=UPI000C113E63|nr:bifunctional ornithine acetyltransferase/N-acetylglutamate synthase [Paracoccaceae bacterium]MBT24905.1 bifunctional ornithine acetyltransferase/N-acetylglutamate synthase [Paracoccaceae bacterium]